ncbi:MAG: ATP-dependent Clp protease proteolytic subunit [Patescibacteria group bacterium]
MALETTTNSVSDLVRQIKSKYITAYVNEFTEESAKIFYNDLRTAAANEQSILPVIIDSYGGYCDSLLSMLDCLLNYPGKIATITMGKAMSCGSILLACGSAGMRYASPNSRVMVHNVSAVAWGKVPEMKVSVDESARLEKQIFHIMAKRCGQEKDYFLDLMKKNGNVDIYLTPDMALKHKIVDYIRVPKLDVNVKVSLSLE